MKRAISFGLAAMISVALLSGHTEAQVAPQTVELAKVNVQKLAAGYRASKVIGSSVTNDTNETIGKIDDLLVSPDGKEPYAVLSIGGFLGVGTHLVAVPYDNLKLIDKKLVLPGGTKEGLRMLPEFKYAVE
jgi:PRC-barrel domain protein